MNYTSLPVFTNKNTTNHPQALVRQKRSSGIKREVGLVRGPQPAARRGKARRGRRDWMAVRRRRVGPNVRVCGGSSSLHPSRPMLLGVTLDLPLSQPRLEWGSIGRRL
ncbi:hypothetical protein E2C01_054750 [Portunus trituberculatus]|uniref:Uncharacterized protein n=1 Tax=Portunus trituberculatus TaxID=210409 RepID=A0A5B7GVU8_PORTR|nr:hypothetical protein [Portunus trituberculatus]